MWLSRSVAAGAAGHLSASALNVLSDFVLYANNEASPITILVLILKVKHIAP